MTNIPPHLSKAIGTRAIVISKPMHEVIIDMIVKLGLSERHQINEHAFQRECDRWAANFKDCSFLQSSPVIDDASQEYLLK